MAIKLIEALLIHCYLISFTFFNTMDSINLFGAGNLRIFDFQVQLRYMGDHVTVIDLVAWL